MKRSVYLFPILVSLFWCSTALGLPTTQYVGVDLFTLSGANLGDIGSSAGGNPVGNGQIVGISGGGTEAAVWTGPNGAHTSLHSPNALNFTYSAATGTDGLHQVGYAYMPNQHAVLWSGTAASAVDLHPKQLSYLKGSYATGVSGAQQVGAGIGSDGFTLHALLWNGTAQSAVDLYPTKLTGIGNNVATATDGAQQVGFVNREVDPATLQGHAILWSGTAESAVDLHPTQRPSFRGSQAQGVGGGQQVGLGIVEIGNTSEFHALLWSGSAASAVDLHPIQIPGIYSSTANDADGVLQVGFIQVKPSFAYRAVLWNGTAESIVDLHALLPPGLRDSFAYSIEGGNVYGIATDLAGQVQAVMWTPVVVPEPATAILAISVLATWATRRRKRAAW